jgi:ferredoxin-NADP reductase/MOSC domain-containing protein YiiM
MANPKWTPPPPPDPSTLQNPPHFKPFPLLHLRAGKIDKLGPFTSAIAKSPLPFPVTITAFGIASDEHAYPGHCSPDKALLHYHTSHYQAWKDELPASASLFHAGGFGENMNSTEVSEMNICIGDQLAIGDVVVLEVREPRTPCAKLNHRFKVPDMARRTQRLLRTGWLYRVVTPGIVYEGDVVRLLHRPVPEWTVARVMYYLFIETGNLEMAREIVGIEALGWYIKDVFRKRLEKGEVEDQDARLFGGEREKLTSDLWSEYRVREKRRETSRVTAFVLEAVDGSLDLVPVAPGSHVRVKLGGKLVRAYSVVGGHSARFEIGVSLDEQSRGGSKYLHEEVRVGGVLTVGRITASFPLVADAQEYVIVAAGIGITAFLAALVWLQNTRQRFHLHYAHSGEVPFRSRLDALGDKATIYDKSQGQRMDIDDIVSKACNGSHIYTCGPQRLMDGVVDAAKRHCISDSRVHLEQFVATTSGNPFTAELKQSKKTIQVGPAQSLLDALKAVGLDVDSSCEVGNCGTCKVDVCAGRVEHRGTGLLEAEKAAAMLSCVSRGIGTIVLDL